MQWSSCIHTIIHEAVRRGFSSSLIFSSSLFLSCMLWSRCLICNLSFLFLLILLLLMRRSMGTPLRRLLRLARYEMFSWTAFSIFLCMLLSFMVFLRRWPRNLMSDVILSEICPQRRSIFCSQGVLGMMWQAFISQRSCKGFQMLCCLCLTRESQSISASLTCEEVGEKSFRTSPWLAAVQAISGLNRPEAMLSKSSNRMSPQLTAISLEWMQSMRLCLPALRSFMRSLPTRDRSLRRGSLTASILSTRWQKLKWSLSRVSLVQKGLWVPRMIWKIFMFCRFAAQKFQSSMLRISSSSMALTDYSALLGLHLGLTPLSTDSETFLSISVDIFLQDLARVRVDWPRMKSFSFNSLVARMMVSLVVCMQCRSLPPFPLLFFFCSSSSSWQAEGAQYSFMEKGLRWNLANRLSSFRRLSSSTLAFSSRANFSSISRFLVAERIGRSMPQQRGTALMSYMRADTLVGDLEGVGGTLYEELGAKQWLIEVSRGSFLTEAILLSNRFQAQFILQEYSDQNYSQLLQHSQSTAASLPI